MHVKVSYESIAITSGRSEDIYAVKWKNGSLMDEYLSELYSDDVRVPFRNGAIVAGFSHRKATLNSVIVKVLCRNIASLMQRQHPAVARTINSIAEESASQRLQKLLDYSGGDLTWRKISSVVGRIDSSDWATWNQVPRMYDAYTFHVKFCSDLFNAVAVVTYDDFNQAFDECGYNAEKSGLFVF